MASIEPKTTVLGYYKAAHLLRRASYRITKTMINEYAIKTPQQALDDLFTFSPPNPTRPLNASKQTYYVTSFEPTAGTSKNTDLNREREWWLYNAYTSPNIQYKLSFFLHTLFITSNTEVNPWTFYDYLELLRYHTNDSLKNLAIRMTRDNMMLIYLNNKNNIKSSPDQNYAREFLELFTILKGPQKGTGDYTNYTEHDVQQAARIFTGFTIDSSTLSSTARITNVDPITKIPRGIIKPEWHDTGNKTFSSAFNNTVILGGTNHFGIQQELENFVTMVFNQPETAKNYCRRLYRYFVSRNITEEIESDIITPLANTMLSNNYNIVPVVKQLLCSLHFYDEDDTVSGDEIIGGLVKSHIDLMLQMNTIFDYPLESYESNPSNVNGFFFNRILRYASNVSFSIFAPITVEGYVGYSNSPHYDKFWITTGTLRIRYQNSSLPNDIAKFISNPNYFTDPSNADTLLEELYDLLFVATPQEDRHTYFKNELLGKLSTINWRNEWNNYIATKNSTSVTIALNKVINAMIKSPEYQVM